MIRSLPDRANLEHLRDEAKTLLQELAADEPAALTRIRPYDIGKPYKLAHAQLTIAREYGFASWAKLKEHVTDLPTKQTQLFQAIRERDSGAVERLLKAYPTLANSKSPSDFDAPPLNIAASRDDVRSVELLLDAGADPNAMSGWWAGGFVPLDFSNEEVTRLLLSRGARMTAHAASRLGWIDELRRLVDEDPSWVNRRGGDGQMPLHFAKTADIVDLLLERGADIEARDVDHEGTPAQHAILNRPVLDRLLFHGATPDVFIATAIGDIDMLRKILEADPQAAYRSTDSPDNAQVPKAPGWHIYTYSIGFVSPDQVATRFGHQKAYDLLFELAPEPQQFLFACRRGDGEVARGIKKKNPNIVSELSEPDLKSLPLAAWERNVPAVKLMLELEFDPNIRNDEQSTPVDRAAFHGFDDVIEAVLPYKPDLTVVNAYGGTPVTCCMYGSIHSWRKDGDHARCLKLLLDAGAPLPKEISGSPAVQDVLRHYMG